MVKQWHDEKDKLGQVVDSQEEQNCCTSYDTCTAIIQEKQRVVGHEAQLIGGSLVVPPIDKRTHSTLQRYFGDIKGFGAVDELVMIVTGGVSVNAVAFGADLERALQYGNHSSVTENLSAIWENIGDDVRRQKILMTQESAARDIPNLRLAPLAAVVTHKVLKINGLSFDVQNREKNGGLHGDTNPETVPRCLCAEALRKFPDELVILREKFAKMKLLMSKVDVSDAFRNAREDQHEANNLCYTVGELVVMDFRLTFRWSGSPGFWGVISSAASHAHCLTRTLQLHE